MPFLNSPAKLKSSHSHSRVEVVPKDHEGVVFRAFNKHARECSRCAKPLDVARRGDMLCDKGHEMAIDIAEILYSIAGKKAQEYRATTGWYGILMDLTEFDGAVVDLVRALDYGLRERKPSTLRPPVFSVPVGRQPPSRHATFYDVSSSPPPSSRHHHHPKHYDSASSTPRVIHHHRTDSPRGSGIIRVPGADEGREKGGHYEEVYHHSSGSKGTTKYYRPQPPKLQRSNTMGPGTTAKTVSTGRTGSKVRFNEEVRYYT